MGKNQLFNAINKEYEKFGREFFLKGEMINLDSIVMASVAMFYIDSFLLFQHHTGSYFFSIYDMTKKKFLGRFLQRGRGPNEFISIDFFDESIIQNNQRYLYLSAINEKRVVKFNLSYFLQHDTISIEVINQHKNLQMNTHTINDSTFFAYMFSENDRGLRVFYRKYFSNSPLFDEINLTKSYVKDYEGLDKLWAGEYIRYDHQKMEMAMMSMNRIHIFDLDDPKKNVSVFPKVLYQKSLRELVLQDNIDEIIYYDVDRASKEYIFALFYNQSLAEWGKVPTKVEIHVFDWNGVALYKLSVNEYLGGFCIDHLQKKMYGYDRDENIYQYDLSLIL